jgi:DNA-binding NarL/FixJ family response regulator
MPAEVVQMIRVLVVDDHELVRDGVIAALRGAGDIEVIGACTDGEQAVEQAEAAGPDVILMDLSMPVLDGIEATRRIVARDPGARIVILTAAIAGHRRAAAERAGALDWVCKSADLTELLETVRRVARSPVLGGGSPL